MHFVRYVPSFISVRCLHRQSRYLAHGKRYVNLVRKLSSSSALPQEGEQKTVQNTTQDRTNDTELGVMSRRLAQMTDESLEQGGRGAQKALNEADFSEELKSRLEAKILDSKFRSDNPSAFAELNMPAGAGQGTRIMATSQPWTGAEAVEDAALRMLTDAHKPLRGTGPAKIPTPSISVDMRMKRAVQKSQGQRLANARDRTSAYALSQDRSLTEHEREQMRKQLKERFTGARPMPGTVQGLAALANERIEDAIARGQFQNIARGKGKNIERDYTASSPFLDTTEYFMNKIIQKQEIVPPWIEKQQELVKAAAVFRNRLRADWKRHAVRVIASSGGGLNEQVRRAQAHAAAEAALNPRTPKSEAISGINAEGKLSPSPPEPTPQPPEPTGTSATTTTTTSPSHPPSPPHPPFRDPAWESLEHAYHTLAIATLNTLARTYNLQAPALARKPYFSLARELAACFADVAPQLAPELVERARAPRKEGTLSERDGRKGGLLARLMGEGQGKVKLSRRPHYGLRQFWREMWGREAWGGGGEGLMGGAGRMIRDGFGFK